MKIKFLYILFSIALVIFNSSVQAKDYAIEVIIFVNKDGLQQSAEQFNADHIIPVANNGILLSEVDQDSLWQPIPEEDLILNDVVNQLKRSGRYRILEHFAWRQPAAERKDSFPIIVKAGRDFTNQFPERAYRHVEFGDTTTQLNDQVEHQVRELDGTIHVAITRYIHLYSDLVYRLPRSNPTDLQDVLDREMVLVDYSVNSHRRMKSRELHYIDHPIVGILVEATPIEEDEN